MATGTYYSLGGLPPHITRICVTVTLEDQATLLSSLSWRPYNTDRMSWRFRENDETSDDTSRVIDLSLTSGSDDTRAPRAQSPYFLFLFEFLTRYSFIYSPQCTTDCVSASRHNPRFKTKNKKFELNDVHICIHTLAGMHQDHPNSLFLVPKLASYCHIREERCSPASGLSTPP